MRPYPVLQGFGIVCFHRPVGVLRVDAPVVGVACQMNAKGCPRRDADLILGQRCHECAGGNAGSVNFNFSSGLSNVFVFRGELLDVAAFVILQRMTYDDRRTSIGLGLSPGIAAVLMAFHRRGRIREPRGRPRAMCITVSRCIIVSRVRGGRERLGHGGAIRSSRRDIDRCDGAWDVRSLRRWRYSRSGAPGMYPAAIAPVILVSNARLPIGARSEILTG